MIYITLYFEFGFLRITFLAFISLASWFIEAIKSKLFLKIRSLFTIGSVNFYSQTLRILAKLIYKNFFFENFWGFLASVKSFSLNLFELGFSWQYIYICIFCRFDVNITSFSHIVSMCMRRGGDFMVCEMSNLSMILWTVFSFQIYPVQ